MLYLFLVTGMLPQTVVFELRIPCAGLCQRLYDKNTEGGCVCEYSVTQSVT